MKKLGMITLLLTVSQLASANKDSTSNTGYEANSYRPIHASDIMWKRTVWRTMDFRDPRNVPYFARNMELTRIMLDAAKAGEIRIYANDSLNAGRQLTILEMLKNLEIPDERPVYTKEELEFIGAEGGTMDENGVVTIVDTTASYFTPRDLYSIELKQHFVFDKNRSRMFREIESFSLYIPAEHPLNTKGIDIPIASFSYKELMNGPFKYNPKARYYNPRNQAANLTYQESFDLNLFYGHITKINNPADNYIIDRSASERTAYWDGLQQEYDLMEFEYNLWEY